MSAHSVVRIVIYGLSILFGIVVLALAADFINIQKKFGEATVTAFQGLGIANGVFNLVFLLTFLVIRAIRPDAPFSANIVELPVIGFLTILWIAEAGVTTNGVSGKFSVDCDNAIKLSEQLNTKNPDLDIIISICQKARAAQGLSFVVWILLMIYGCVTIGLCATGKISWRAERRTENKARTVY